MGIRQGSLSKQLEKKEDLNCGQHVSYQHQINQEKSHSRYMPIRVLAFYSISIGYQYLQTFDTCSEGIKMMGKQSCINWLQLQYTWANRSMI